MQLAQIRIGEIGVEMHAEAGEIVERIRVAQGRQILRPRFLDKCAGQQVIVAGAGAQFAPAIG